jgi:creatinine amidohydrolase
MTGHDPIRYWQSLATRDVPAVVARDPVVILPLAAIEQHGPHLPLSTDLDIGLGLLARAFQDLGEDFPAWQLPPQAVGSSQEHLRLAGTLSLQAPTLSAIIEQQGAALAACGVRRLVISNSHGGNRHALDLAALTLRRERAMLVVKASYFDFPRPTGVDLPDSEWRHGLHGGAVETAMMLHLRPELVREPPGDIARALGEDLEATLVHLRPEGAASFAWLAEDLGRHGIAGDPRRADVEMGRRLVAGFGKTLADVIRDARVFPLERLA